MFKRLICRFTNGKRTFTVMFWALTELGLQKKAAAFQEKNGYAMLSSMHC